MLRFLTDKRTAYQRSSGFTIEFYREEFRKHQRCLERQREYYSERAISDVERALTQVMSQLDRLCEEDKADQVVSRVLRQFELVAGLSAWADPRKVN